MHRSKQHLYPIISSARASNCAGTSMPSSFAVFSETAGKGAPAACFRPQCALQNQLASIRTRAMDRAMYNADASGTSRSAGRGTIHNGANGGGTIHNDANGGGTAL